MTKEFCDKPDKYLELECADTPKDANFWISGKCNFACRYCIHGAKKDDPARKDILDEMLSWEHFVKMADELGKFPQKVRSASFCGIGEPTINPLLPQMVSYLKTNKIVDYVEVTTNGSLLTNELSLRLIGAGVDFLTVSIQGVTDEDYVRVCGNRISPQKIADNVKWFHDHSINTIVYVRTLDYAVPTDEKRVEFFSMFEDCCDKISVAYAIKMFQGMDYKGVVDEEVDQYDGGRVCYSGYCPLVFSSIHLFPNGDISPCPLPKGPGVLGNIDSVTLQEAWNSRQRLKLLREHAKACRKSIEACAECTEPDMLVGDSKIPQELLSDIEKKLELCRN